MIRLWWQLTRRQSSARLTSALAVTAFAFATGALLLVLGGLGAFTDRAVLDPEEGQVYVVLAQTATVILLVPSLSLGGAAARLSMARRNERMSALRLAGATSGQVARLTLLDTLSQAVAGVLAGVVVYLAAVPAVAPIPFQGRPFALAELWVGWPVLLLTLAVVLVLALGSALLSLWAVTATPLGVANRVSPRALSVVRAVVLVVGLLTWTAVLRQPSVTFILLGLGFCFGTLTLVGPFVLGLVGRLVAHRARRVETLLAARRLVDDPRGAWRGVGALAMTTFVAGLLTIGPALGQAMEGHLDQDVFAGSLLTLGIAGVLAAVSAGVTQASKALEQQPVSERLQMAGTELAVLHRTRMRETMLPLLCSVGLAAVVSLAMIAPLGLQLVTASWVGVVTYLVAVVASVLLVALAVRLTQPLVRPLA